MTVLVLATLAGVACGKKGPPLPPFVRVPAAISDITATRMGDEVWLTITLPDRNIDDSRPVSLEEVIIYGFTGRNPPPRQRWGELGTLVDRVKVARVGADVAWTEPALPEGTLRQITVLDQLTPDQADPRSQAEAALEIKPALLRRFYVAVPVGAQGLAGGLGTVVDVDLLPRPGAPADVTASYDRSTLSVSWAAPADGEAFLLARRERESLTEFDVQVPSVNGTESWVGSWRYNVYREGDTLVDAGPPGTSSLRPRPQPLNAAPQPTTTFALPVVFDKKFCLAVRAVHGTGVDLAEGTASGYTCVTPIDTFPPAPPRQLAALPSAGAIELIWEINDESDLAGYVVLRTDATGASRRLMEAPIAETRYRDGAVARGVKYFYAVVAVDLRGNESAESNRVEDEPR